MLAGPAAASDLPSWSLPDGRAFAEGLPHAGPPPGDAHPPWPVSARLEGPTDRYNHDVLGGIPSFASLTVGSRSCGRCRHGSESATVTLPPDLVFEDVAPRLWDVDGDGRPEIVVVEAHVDRGARLAVWAYPETGAGGADGLRRIAATPFIGTRHRWLAPVGAADFDGDGSIDLAYVETPHLGRTLHVVSLRGDRLERIASLSGVTNHRIGEPFISGGLRECGAGPEAILASPDWRRLVIVWMQDERLHAADRGPNTGPESFDAALACS